MYAPTALVLLLLASSSTPAAASKAQPCVAIPCGDAYLGVYLHGADGGAGARVARVVEGSPAARAGLRAGDRILGLAGEKVAGPDALAEAIRGRRAGEAVELDLLRGRASETVIVVLGEAAPEAQGEPSAAAGDGPAPLEAPGTEEGRRRTSVDDAAPDADAALAAELEARLAEMRRQADERFAELEGRLGAMRTGDADPDRLERLRREIEEDRAAREQRFDELQASIRRALEERRERAGREAEPRRDATEERPRERAPRRTARVLPMPRLQLRGVAPRSDERQAATLRDVQELRDDVRALRDEIRALRELLEVR